MLSTLVECRRCHIIGEVPMAANAIRVAPRCFDCGGRLEIIVEVPHPDPVEVLQQAIRRRLGSHGE